MLLPTAGRPTARTIGAVRAEYIGPFRAV